MEEYEEVKKWLTAVKESSKKPYLTGLSIYTDYTGLNPKQLIDEAEEDRKKPRREQGKPEYRLSEFYKYLLNDYERRPSGKRKTSEGKKGVSKSMASTYVGAVRGFYKRNGFAITIKTPKATPRKENRKLSLSPTEVKKLVNHAPTLRDRAVILMMFQGGFDVATICDLDYGDVKRELETEREPMLIHVVREKEEVDYFTFVGNDSVEALKAYLNDRRKKGEEIKPNTPLFTMEGRGKNSENNRLKTNLIQNMMKRTAMKAGIISEEDLNHSDINPCRPHALRSGFSTILRMNGFDPMLVEFMQGHAIPYNGAYLIPPEEKVRQMYAEVEPQLSVSGTSPVEKRLDEKLKAYRDDLTELQKENKELRRQNEQMRKEIDEIKEVINELKNNK